MKESAPASAGHTLSSRIAKEPNTSKRRRLIHAASGTNTTKFVKHLYDEVIRLYHVDLAQAERLADAARLISGYMKNELAQALACRSEGHVLLARGQYENALQRYSEALAIYRRRGDELEVGRTLYSGSLQALIYLSRYEQAFAWAEEARAIFEARGDRLRLARLDSNMGNVLFRQDRYAAALKLYRQAYRELLRQGRHQDVAVALHNIATCCISLNDFNEALRTYQRARNYCSEAAMPLLAAQAEYNIAYLHYLHGQYATALRLYEHTRSRCFEIGDPYHAALSDLDQSEICLELNLTDEASRLAERASESFSTLNLKYEEAKALTNLAISASRLGRVDQASELFEKARTLFDQEQNKPWSALVDLHEGLMFYESGQDARAERLCRSALHFYSSSPLPGKTALCEILLSRLKLRSHDPKAAIASCTSAINRLKGGALPAQSCRAFFSLGQAQEFLGDNRAALRSYRRLIEYSNASAPRSMLM